MNSRSRSAYGKGVTAPMSIAMVPTEIRWLEMRFSSQAITRQYSARLGICMPSRRSTAMAQPWLANMAAM